MGTHYDGTAKETLVLDTWIKLSRAKETVGRMLRRKLDGQRITMTQFSVLEILEHRGPLPLKEIGNKILLSSSNLVTVIDNLERQELVIRRQNKEDRRSLTISITDNGKITIKPIFQDHLSDLSQWFSILNDSELNTLGKLCKKLGTQRTPTK